MSGSVRHWPEGHDSRLDAEDGSTRAEYAWVDWSGPFLPTVLAPYVTGREVAG